MPTLKLKALKYYDDKVLDDNLKKKKKSKLCVLPTQKIKKTCFNGFGP